MTLVQFLGLGFAKRILRKSQAMFEGAPRGKMELENTNAAMQPDSPDLLLSEPHFEDEATLLSARPVVPLDEPATLEEEPPAHEVERSAAGFPRGWILAATVVVAMLLGALGSALYLSLTNRE